MPADPLERVPEDVLPEETILPDDYPVYAGYAYVADGKPMSSPIDGTVRRLKLALQAAEIRRCDIVGRQRQADLRKGNDHDR